MLMLMTSAALFSQVDCNLFNIQDLAADYLSFGVDTVILQSDGSYEIQLSNGTTASITFGCTDPLYFNYDSAANTDDGSCKTCEGIEFDGCTYAAVEIGDQCWFAENLRTTVYADGSAIPEVTDNIAWAGLSTGARCDYDNNASNVATYGRLYNWYAVADAAGLCPTGWHVATDDEWTDLENHISSQGFSGTEGTALKLMTGWGVGANGTDDFGFSALPGGNRFNDDGVFYVAGSSGLWWSSSPSGGSAWSRHLYGSNPGIIRSNDYPRYGFSVRCLRDAE